MNYKARICLTKIVINTLGWLSFLSMFSYMIPIAISFETNVYDMSHIAKLFIIAMVTYCIFLTSLIKIIGRYNNIEDPSSYKSYIKEMIDLLHTLGKGNTLIEMLILFFIAVIITYAVWWWKADVYPLEAAFEYVWLVIGATSNTALIIKYINNFNHFTKRLYEEVYK